MNTLPTPPFNTSPETAINFNNDPAGQIASEAGAIALGPAVDFRLTATNGNKSSHYDQGVKGFVNPEFRTEDTDML